MKPGTGQKDQRKMPYVCRLYRPKQILSEGRFSCPSIDRLVDNASGFRLLSLMDAYSGYNQIAMFTPDREKTAFLTNQGNFAYQVMPFGLKNAGATCQRMLNKVFQRQIGKTVEVYLDDMIAKSE